MVYCEFKWHRPCILHHACICPSLLDGHMCTWCIGSSNGTGLLLEVHRSAGDGLAPGWRNGVHAWDFLHSASYLHVSKPFECSHVHSKKCRGEVNVWTWCNCQYSVTWCNCQTSWPRRNSLSIMYLLQLDGMSHVTVLPNQDVCQCATLHPVLASKPSVNSVAVYANPLQVCS